MAPGGRAGFRGGSSRGGPSRGGSRGRGSTRGRGRGRGRAVAQQPRSARFDDKRLASKDESESEAEGESPSEHESDGMEVDSDEEDEEEAQSSQPYLSLMRSLVESAPKAKRRKLDHASAEDPDSAKPEAAPETANDEEDGEERDVDFVEEPEEDPTNVAPEDLFDEDDDLDISDPFEVHFADPKKDELRPRLEAIQGNKWRMERIAAKSTRIFFNTPDAGDAAAKPLPAPVSGISDLKLKKRLQEAMAPKHPKFDQVEQTIAPLLFNYQDMLYCNRTVAGSQGIRRMASLHALNHVFKTRDRIVKDNARLSRAEGNEDLELRDQGFTRPKVLMLLPTRQSCVKMVDMIVSICEPDQQENRKRFEDGYIDKQSKFSNDKPDDFKDLFSGSDDDMFRLGMKFTRKTIKYFSQFYNSDIIFASPLGLRMAIGSEEEKKLDFDFLSSIELVIVDQADALLMQNWEHVEFIFEHLNIQPKDAHGCDFSRVRSWYLDDQAKHFRQTAIFSAFNTPELAELLRAHCHNWAGKARLQQESAGTIQYLPVKARQTFNRFDAATIAADPDARFAYFTKAIVPMLARHRGRDAAGTLVFIPSYLDFVRVRNYFANSPAVENVSFGTISEYADVPEASRARSHFLNGRHKVLLYTERAHHFRRYQIKGVKRVVMYALPDNPLFYQEIAGGYLQKSEQSLLLEHGQGIVRVMFSKYDVMKLERIVGTSRVGKMIHDQGDTFDFV
ncbi:U3 small nucleolar RNA-associated protein 25 [Chaetomium sp. MPI-CAGE-AT-0009]|nr:U3 small nucleolar RNA-associated protein 25 [Chaetomium sp. MPI-CAGE-AT-0009]